MSTGMPKKNAAYTMYVSLVDQTDTKLFKAAPTIAAGDFKVSKDGGALTNLATLPTVTPAASRLVKISLSATEMNADDVVVMCVDAAGAEWADLMIHLKPETRVLSDLAYPTVSGRSVDVTAGGTVGIDWANVEAPTTTVGLSGTTVGVTTLNSDMRGTDNAALASVVGALTDAAAAGDPTATDTLMQYAKQLVNTLEGTAGIPVFPASADPANNVSLAESIRAIRDDVTGLAGAAMRGTDGVDTAPMRGTDGANTTTPLTAAQVNAEVDTALADVNLDHLVGTATAIPAVPAGTFLDQIMDDGTAVYDRTTDSLQAVRDRGDAAWTTGAGGSSADQPPAQEFVRQKASTNQTIDVYIASDTASGGKTGLVFNSAGASCYYRRGPTGTATQLVLATQTVGGAHTDGGFVEIDSTNMPGHYRLDLSDAVVATGVDFVDLMLNFTGAMAMPMRIVLTADDVNAAAPTNATIADAVWDEDVVAAHGTADTAGLIVSQLTKRAVTMASDVIDGSALGQMVDDGTAVYDRTTDSLQAIRDRGDGSWITGGGGGITDILNVQPVVPTSIDLAGTATVRVGFMLTNAVDDLPTTAEITPGTIDIHRKAIGGTTWTAVVTAAACSEQAGMIYYDEVFDAASGYAEGDSIRLTFKSQKITVAANDYNITDANGVMFQTEVRQTMRGTDGANTTTPPSAASINSAVEAGQVGTDTAAILVDTAEIGVAGAGLTNVNLPDQTMNITGNLSGSVGSVTGAVGSVAGHTPQTGDSYARLGAPAGVSVSADNAAIKADTAEIGTAGAGLTDLGGMSTTMKAQVNAEVDTAIDTDATTLPGQVAPTATPSLRTAIAWLYKTLRNKTTQTATQWSLYDDVGTTVDAKATVSDDGTTATKGEIGTGP